MTPVEILMEEHRHIERMLGCLEAMSVVFTAERRIDATAARDALEFLRGYADRGHHGKEEEQLFPALERNGLSPDCGPTAVMRYEHKEGRACVKEMSEAVEAGERGDVEASRRFARAANAYVHLLREHIQKEDHCLFPMVAQTLGANDQAVLAENFARFEREEMGNVRKTLVGCLERLEERFAFKSSPQRKSHSRE